MFIKVYITILHDGIYDLVSSGQTRSFYMASSVLKLFMEVSVGIIMINYKES